MTLLNYQICNNSFIYNIYTSHDSNYKLKIFIFTVNIAVYIRRGCKCIKIIFYIRITFFVSFWNTSWNQCWLKVAQVSTNTNNLIRRFACKLRMFLVVQLLVQHEFLKRQFFVLHLHLQQRVYHLSKRGYV